MVKNGSYTFFLPLYYFKHSKQIKCIYFIHYIKPINSTYHPNNYFLNLFDYLFLYLISLAINILILKSNGNLVYFLEYLSN